MKDLIKQLFVKSQLNVDSITDAFRELFDDYKIELTSTGYFLYSECDGTLYNYDGITYRNLVGIYKDSGGFKRFSQFKFSISLESLISNSDEIDSLRSFYEQRIKILDDINFCFKRLQNHTITVTISDDEVIFNITSVKMSVSEDEYEFLSPMVDMYEEISTDLSSLYATKLAKIDNKYRRKEERDSDEYEDYHYTKYNV